MLNDKKTQLIKLLPKPDRFLRTLSQWILAAVSIGIVTTSAFAAERDERIAKLYEDALARYERKDYVGTEIQLKNALQLNTRYLPGQVLLGKAQLALGKSIDAEKSLKAAMQLGVDRSEVMQSLAQAYFDQGKFQNVIDLDPAGLSPKVKIDLLTLRAYAQIELGQFQEATRTVETMRGVDARASGIPTALATILLRQNKAAEAKKQADLAISLAPRDAKAWNLHGTISHALGDAKGALADYAQSLQLEPAFSEPRIARAALLLDQGRDKEASAELDQLQGLAKKDPRASYLRAVFYAKAQNPTKMREALQETTRSIDVIPIEALSRYPQLLLIGGLAHNGIQSREKAQVYLQHFLAVNPNHAGARKVLAALLITNRNFVKAISILEPIQRTSPNDPYTLSLLATANMGLGQHQTATRLMEQAVAANNDAPQFRASLGFSMLGGGDVDSGISQLRQSFQSDPTQTHAGIAIAILEMKRGQPKAALEIANKLVERQPNNPLLQNLLGAIKAATDNRAGSRAAYEKAIKIDPKYDPPRLNLARLDLAEGKYDAARAQLQAILKRDEKQTQALFELARVESAAGHRDEAVRHLEKIRALSPRDMQAAAGLMDLYIARKNLEKVIQLIREMEPQTAGHFVGLAALGRGYLALAEKNKAIATFGRMTDAAGNDPAKHSQIANYHLMANNLTGARQSLNKALAIAPGFLGAEAQLIALDLLQGDITMAEQRFRGVRNRSPDDTLTYRLQGDIAMSKKAYAEAIGAYQSAHAKQKQTDSLIRLTQAFQQNGNNPKALELLTAWVKTHPYDETAAKALAEAQLRANNPKAARQTYENVLKINPNDLTALNNLAFLLTKDKDPNAIVIAEKAYRIAPEDASINDTLGWVLLSSGKPDKALHYLREARLRNPQSGEIRYHLAFALTQLGRREEARKELEPAFNGNPFESQDAARKLLGELSRK